MRRPNDAGDCGANSASDRKTRSAIVVVVFSCADLEDSCQFNDCPDATQFSPPPLIRRRLPMPSSRAITLSASAALHQHPGGRPSLASALVRLSVSQFVPCYPSVSDCSHRDYSCPMMLLLLLRRTALLMRRGVNLGRSVGRQTEYTGGKHSLWWLSNDWHWKTPKRFQRAPPPNRIRKSINTQEVLPSRTYKTSPWRSSIEYTSHQEALPRERRHMQNRA